MTDLLASEQRAVEALRGAREVIVCGHVAPDGDAIGSTLAITLALRSIGVDSVPTLADDRGGPATYAFLPGFDLLRPASELSTPDVFLALDSPSLPRLGVAAALASSARTLVVLDHHPDNARFGHINVADAGAASTGSIVWRMLPALGVTVTPEIAVDCYTALMTDTGRFSYSNTDAATLRDAAAMVEGGADPSAIYLRIYESRSPASLALLGRTLSRLTIANRGQVAYSWIRSADLTETGALPEETENLVDAVRQTAGVTGALFFKEGPDGVKVALRSKTAALDVSAVARAFGGGGHTAASGATLTMPLEAAIEAVLARMPGSAS